MALRSWKTGWLSDEIKQPLQINISNEDGYEIIQPFSVGFANEDSTKHWQVASAIRRSLYYETISYREDAIPCTYETTFEWIFEPLAQCKQPGLWSSFPSWLESESKSIYWITGKPGSGKSTLMKYITSKATLKEHLLRWSNDIPLLLASFYFWQAGTDVQKSQDGLLRSLLSQCLEQMPSVGRIACPKRWAFHEIFGPDIDAPPWEWGELVDSFHSLTSKSCNNYKLALFIDGLDEFSGNHASLVQFIEKISACDGIKICVSSRPWNVFSDAYKSTPSLRLEDLTKKDIELFVTRHFELHPGFKELSGIFPHEVNHLSETIVTKARGVFLWVSIVVQSLLTGLEDGDKLSDLQATLNDLPEDLQDLFQRIWDSIDERHKGNALQFIQLHRTARGPLHAVNLWLADEESPFQLDIKQLQIDKLVQVMKRRLNSRTKCLLEISFHGHVEYIHRTAYDWIQDVWQNICLDIPDEFDAFLELAKAESCYFLIAETLGDRGGPPGDQDWYWEPIQTCFWYAMKVKDTRSNTKRLIQILEHLHSNMQKVMESITWMSIRCTLLHKTDFIGLAAQFAIQPYVRAKISKKGKVHGLDTGQMSVLESVIFGWDCFPMEMIDELKCRENFASSARLELIGYLIEIGADTSCTCHTGDQISEAVVKRYGPSDEYGDAVLELLKKASAPAGRSSKRFWRKERKRVEK
ncbi:hypothetical protein F5882DRAFT_408405 [Hyaloscypha sp. PMI_1271]|nr:hypothetical protein F5882DRAFT_408405 [Hyaloscypha sp. PMI_1271]